MCTEFVEMLHVKKKVKQRLKVITKVRHLINRINKWSKRKHNCLFIYLSCLKYQKWWTTIQSFSPISPLEEFSQTQKHLFSIFLSRTKFYVSKIKNGILLYQLISPYVTPLEK